MDTKAQYTMVDCFAIDQRTGANLGDETSRRGRGVDDFINTSYGSQNLQFRKTRRLSKKN